MRIGQCLVQLELKRVQRAKHFLVLPARRTSQAYCSTKPATCPAASLPMAPSDSEDEDIKRAIALSLENNSRDNHAHAVAEDLSAIGDFSRANKLSNAVPNTGLGLASLDRKAMEQERLARLSRKRERSVSPPSARGSRKAPMLETNTVELPSGARLKTFSSLVDQDQQSRKSEAAHAANRHLKGEANCTSVKAEPRDDQQAESLVKSEWPSNSGDYPSGTVKRTWAFGFPRDGKDIKLEEVLEPATLRTAVLSAFQWDMPWIMSKLRTPGNGRGTTKMVFVMQAKEKELREQMLRETAEYSSFLRLCFPPMVGLTNCMHSKLMLLFHANKLRIAIPTANLLSFDWGETGVMENSVFMIDLPRLPGSKKGQLDSITSFGKELIYFLEKQEVDGDVRDGLLSFDFTATKDIAFVHTVGGMNYNKDAERTGLPGLSQAVRELYMQSHDKLEIDFAASSIGSLNDDFLHNVHAAACGEDLIARAQASTTKAKSEFFSAVGKKGHNETKVIREKIRIYFPTQETVKSSIAGAAGTICLSRKWFEAGTFPRTCFRDYRCTRPGLLSHNKILYARGKQANQGLLANDVAWAYVGSANVSKSAWGELIYDRKQKAWKVNCRNWECGVILPAVMKEPTSPLTTGSDIKQEPVEGSDSETDVEEKTVSPVCKGKVKAGSTEINAERSPGSDAPDSCDANAKLVDMSVFDAIVKPPFEVPGQRYGGQQPWYFQEQ